TMDVLQRHRQPGPRIAHAHARASGTRSAPARAGLAAEQAFEEVAEAPARAATGEHVLVIESCRATATEARRRHLVAGTVATSAQLVVGLAPGGIAQRLVGLVDCLELVLGASLLADVGMIFAREPAVRGLDLRLAGVGLDA